MKVLAVFPPLRDANAGGIQVAGQIAWAALQRGTDASLLEVSAQQRWRGVLAARSQPDVFDVVLFWHLDLLRLAPLISRRARRVVFLHGIEAWRRPDLLTRRVLKDSIVLANSRYTIDRARTYLPSVATAQVVHLGVGEPGAPGGVPADPPVALMISRLDGAERYKGHHEVIAAWPRVQERLPHAQLWIVGHGDLREELEAAADEHSIRFFGRVTEAEKLRLLEAARCLVLPSRAEGFGLVYLEAMRNRRPCLVGIDAGREVVNPPEAGLGVDPADEGALVQALIALLSPGEQWERMADAALHRYRQSFTASHFQQRLLAALAGID